MKKSEAEKLKCPKLLGNKNLKHQYCCTIECMAWIDTGGTTVQQVAQIPNIVVIPTGYCSKYGSGSMFTRVQNI